MDFIKPSDLPPISLRRIARNMLALLTSEGFDRATIFIMYAMVGRYLGTFQFGQLALALTLFYIFRIFSSIGLKTLITREVAKDRAKTAQYLSNSAVLVTITSLLTIFIGYLVIRLMGYPQDTARIVFILSLGVLPYSLSTICEGVFLAWEKMHYIAYANVPVNLLKVGLIILGLLLGYDLYFLVGVLLISLVVLAVVEWWIVLRYMLESRGKIDIPFSLGLLKSTSTFLSIEGVIAIKSSILVLLLSKLADETAVGLFSAAGQVLVPLQLVIQNVVLSLFPMMCRNFDSGIHALKQVAEHLLEVLFLGVLPALVGLFFLAKPVMLLLYGDVEFLQAAGVLRILVWTLLLRVATHVLGQVLWASHREKTTLRIVIINTVVTLTIGLLFISQMGLVGAAFAGLVVSTVDFIQHYVPAHRLLSGISLRKLLWKPTVATLCMSIFLYFFGVTPLVVAILLASALYLSVLLLLAIWDSGGISQFKLRYQVLWSRSA